MSKKLLTAVVMGSALVAAAPAMAYEAGDIVVRVGAANANTSTSDKVLGGALDLDVSNDTSIGITGTYMLTDTVGIELLASTPFNHEINSGVLGQIGKTKHLPPTLSVQWFPMGSGSKVQPYVGAGINYTTFFSEEATGALAGSKLKLEDSIGVAVQAGIDVALNDNWLLNAAVWKVDMETDVKLDGTKIGKVEIDPTVYMISVGYKF
ncbi:OmpW family outer membrane protein [Neptuniibacter sp. CAU 1671]|uniref:OmpW/AlkL family protein n=1 Tax=Neptuniibacter sp. CAU 1671 TaxID=3032593 RepID=UPI0023DAA96E|nr:OmpW family outer membrane protein [Neptuniibacter sp. CAU 1671]MDF2180460.1 outer membrane beta-barrel protein [Neptuniibacter sp. CAU 1671]